MRHVGKFAMQHSLPLAMLFALPWACTAPGRAAELASSWVEGFNNKVRLIAGKSGSPEAKDRYFAGIEISMPSGWKTYWRNPGEAGGVPPEFDWTGSVNVSKAEVLYPAPLRLVDPKAGENIGYKDHVILPIALVAQDASKGITLKAKVTYGVCREICVPAEAVLQIDVPTDAEVSSSLDDVVGTVPSGDSRPLDVSRDPVLKSWRVEGGAEKPTLVLEVEDPGGTGGDAFLFSPDSLYMPMTRKISDEGGKAVFTADLTDGVSIGDLKGKSVVVTLAGAKGQSDTKIQFP